MNDHRLELLTKQRIHVSIITDMNKPRPQHPVLALDYDGVVANTNEIKSLWIRNNLGLKVPSWRCDRTQCVPRIGLANYEQMSQVVYGRKATQDAKPVAGAVQSIQRLSQLFGLCIVTARSQEKINWIHQWIGMNSLAPFLKEVVSSEGKSKAEIVAHISAVALLDDDLRHLVRLAEYDFLKFNLAPNLRARYTKKDDLIQVRTWKAFSELIASLHYS